MSITQVLSQIQRELKAPKGQFNDFGKYKYRSCEDILEAVKPLLPDGYILTITDEIVLIGDRYYVKATAQFADAEFLKVECTAYAREALIKKGMDESQITGSASSYARKYALNGLLLIDDTKDADTQKPEEPENKKPVSKPKPETVLEDANNPVWTQLREAWKLHGEKVFNEAKKEIGVDNVRKIEDAKALQLAINTIVDNDINI